MELSTQEQRQKDLFSLVQEGNLVGLREALHTMQSIDGQSLSETLNDRDEEGMTMFLVACEHGHLDIVNEILSQPPRRRASTRCHQ